MCFYNLKALVSTRVVKSERLYPYIFQPSRNVVLSGGI